MSISLIMLGAGSSSRFELPVKKQWLRIKHKPLWLFATQKISKMYDFDKIIVVASKNELSYMKRFANFEFCLGGDSRQESLANALKLVKSKYVMVSDVARVCMDEELIQRLVKAKDKASCIAPFLQATDTVHFLNEPINREDVKLIQTPQLSHTQDLKKALKSYTLYTDDSTAILAKGKTVHYVKGSYRALKLTRKQDLQNLTCLKKPSKDIFIGNGFDVHEFGEKRKLLLGGVCVHESMGVKAHSDGDILAHALVDAILGACGFGDIGELFPDSDEAFKNANSMEMLQKVYSFAVSVGFKLVNADITILAQTPKISPFKENIAKHVAKTLGIKKYKINIKATTTEKLGFIGRREGIGVQATVGLKYYNWKKQ